VTGGGTSDSENKVNYITVNDVPNVSFSETIDGYSVTFDNNTVGGFTYSWNFGDGSSSTAANPTHNYSSAGSYDVTLTSNNDCGSNEFVRTITIADEVTADFEVDQTQGCSDENYTFTSTSIGNVTSYFWEFQDGIPATSTEENPTVSFSSTGTKTVRLTVSNSLYEDTKNELNFIDIVEAPDVDFTYEISDNTVVFDNNTIGGFFYSWDFGDGEISTTPNPAHTYDAPGDYTVVLSSNNNCESGEISKIVSIESGIIARFTASSDEICEGESVQFTSTSEGTITGYFWEFQGGTPATSTDANPSVVYSNSGTFDVKLTVTDGAIEDVETKSASVNVVGSPEVDFEYGINGYSVDFNNLSANADTYTWNFGDGETSTLSDLVHTYSQPGSYDVILEASNSCSTNEKSKTVTIVEIVEANFTYGTSSICEGGTVNFDNSSLGDIQSYFWEFNGGSPSTSTEQNPTVAYNSEGAYSVKLTVTGQFGAQDSKTEVSAIIIEAGPTANFSYTLDEKTVSFSNLSENFDNISWDFGDGSTSSDENPVHTFTEEGDYVVRLEVSGPCGTDEFEVQIPVFDVLLANFQASETTLCPGQELVLQDLSSGNPTEWEWSIMGQEMISVAEQNPVVVLEEPGVYTVELTVRNEEEENSKIIQQYIEVMPLPEVSFTFEQVDLVLNFNNVSQNGKSFYWDFGDGNISTDANPSHEYGEEGNYVVMLRVENDCSVIESEQEVGVFTNLTAGFSTEVTEICESTSIQFNNQSSGSATSWEWSFPGGTPATSNERNPIVTYENAGVFDVILTVNRETEEVIETKSDFVTVNKLPISKFEYEVDKNKVQFFNLSENGTSFEWSFSSEELNPLVEFEEEKAYEITLITTNGCASDTYTQIVDLYEEAKTYANFSISANSYCLGDEISFIDLSSEDITEWNWKFPGATPSESNEKNPVVMYESFGTYDVELTVTNGFNTRTIMLEDYVDIVEKPTAAFSLKQTYNFIEITNLSTNASNIAYNINGIDFEEDLPYYTFPKNGIFKVKQLVSNSCGESIASDIVEIDVYPSAGFSLDITQGCAPLTINFESRSTDNATKVNWILEGSDSPEVEGFTPSVTYSEPGNFGIKVIASNQFGTDTIELNSLIEVFESPTAGFEYEVDGLNVNFSADKEVYDSIRWELGDGTLKTEANFLYEYQEGGIYEVTLRVYKGECSDIITQEIDLRSTSTVDLDDSSSVNIYPNPANSFLKVEFEDNIGVVEKIVVIDQLGQQLLQKDAIAGSSSVTIRNLNNIPSGHYFVGIYVEDAAAIFKKLIIVK
jgi:PKD repeat protein